MSAILVPPRTVVQRSTALAMANTVRLRRAGLKRQVKQMSRAEGAMLVASLIEDQPPWLASMRVEDLLGCLWRWGDVKVAALMGAAEASSRKRLGGLSVRQRGVLVAGLRADAARVGDRA